jgi:hypothetical protein
LGEMSEERGREGLLKERIEGPYVEMRGRSFEEGGGMMPGNGLEGEILEEWLVVEGADEGEREDAGKGKSITILKEEKNEGPLANETISR